jgi:uncharacterized membrane protein
VGWLAFVLQSLNPIGGMSAAIPLGIAVFGLAPVPVALIAGPLTFVTVIVLHLAWERLRRHERVAAWLDARQSPRVGRLLEKRGATVAAAIGGLTIGGTGSYVTLRYLGVAFNRFWAPLLLGQMVKGVAIALLTSAASRATP